MPPGPGSRYWPDMSFIGFVIAGLIIGAIAKLLMPGRDPGGFLVTILLGIAGAVLAGWLGRALGLYGPGEPAGWLMSVIGAVILLAIYRTAFHPSARRA
jgi:uncharacterized membrane protein YeaQ/YmgE (transglycosylase-associated protein family)